jgi:predicted dehydrogenase
MLDTSKIRVGIIGFGYWGPNLARNVNLHPGAELVAVCDTDADNRMRAAAKYPKARLVADSQAVLRADDIDAVVIATPAGTHAFLAKAAFDAGKHVLITKPVSTSAASARALAELAESSGKVLLVDHTFLYTQAVTQLKQLLDGKKLGRALYYDSMRTGLGIFKSDADVIDDLAVHDIAITDYLFDERPHIVSAISAASIPGHLPSLAYVNFHYCSGLHVHIAAHWLSPIKQRKVVIAGSQQMVCWDDTQPEHALLAYESGVVASSGPVVAGRAPLDYRHGTPQPIALAKSEALAGEIDDFIDSIRHRRQPRSCGRAAVRVMQMAEAAGQSARQGGTPINITW